MYNVCEYLVKAVFFSSERTVKGEIRRGAHSCHLRCVPFLLLSLPDSRWDVLAAMTMVSLAGMPYLKTMPSIVRYRLEEVCLRLEIEGENET